MASLFRYPVKSLAGESADSLVLDRRGPRRDRHWMVVDAAGEFMTQRSHARMCLVKARLDQHADTLHLDAPGMAPLTVEAAAAEREGDRIEVSVWQDRVTALGCGAAADAWLSSFLATPCRLVCLPPDARRAVDRQWARADDEVGFADGFPVLLLSQAAVADLGVRLGRPVGIERFRPNIVIDGCAAHAEDRWQRIRIGSVEFRVAKPCSRCAIPTIDPATGERDPPVMRTLMGYRRHGGVVTFGQNLLHDAGGEIAVGMPVEVLA